jgi:ATP-dependent DNA helicase DinG
MLTEQRGLAPKAWIFTSATLGDDEALTWFTAPRAGRRRSCASAARSTTRHARLWVPPRLPCPTRRGTRRRWASWPRARAALGGRTFVLTTTLRVLPVVAEALRPERLTLIEVLVQGSEPRRSAAAALRRRPGQGAVGSHSFWEGIDMPGDALQCVLIDKLPFPPPNDPLVEAG